MVYDFLYVYMMLTQLLLLFQLSQFWDAAALGPRKKPQKRSAKQQQKYWKQCRAAKIYRFASAQMFDFAFSALDIREPLTFMLVMSQFSVAIYV